MMPLPSWGMEESHKKTDEGLYLPGVMKNPI